MAIESKVHVRSGDLEVDCEGSEEFLKQEFPKLLEAVANLRRSMPGSTDPGSSERSAPPKATNVNSLGITSIAAKFGCQSGITLLEAAAAKLTIVDKMTEFSRDNLNDVIKKATGYYKSSYTSNLTNYISGLVKDQRLLDIGGGKYAVPPAVKAEWETKLAR